MRSPWAVGQSVAKLRNYANGSVILVLGRPSVYVCRTPPDFAMPFLRFIPETTNVDFVGWRYYAFAMDGLLMLVALISIVLQGFNLGIDFPCGVLMELKAAQVIGIAKMRTDNNTLGCKQVHTQYIGGGESDASPNSCVLIRVH